jgi:hypothetical protein
MPGYKYPNIDSGATTIRSVGHAPEHPSLSAVKISSTSSTPDLRDLHRVLQWESTVSIRVHRLMTWVEYFLESFKNLKSTICSSASKAWVEYFLEWYKQLESMPGYKYPNIDSGATSIESASRVHNKKTILRKNSTKKRWWRRKFEPMIDYKYPTITSGSTPIGSADRATDVELLQEDNEWRTRTQNLLGGKHKSHGLDIYSHRESRLCT